MTKIKVAMVEPVGGHGGMDYYDFGLCMALIRVGVQPFLFTGKTDLTGRDLPVFPYFKRVFGQGNKLLRGLRLISALFRTFYKSSKNRISIAHFHFFRSGPLEIVQLILCRLFRMHPVVTLHDLRSLSGHGHGSGLLTLVCRFSKALIVHNKWTRRALVNELKRGIGGRQRPWVNKIHVIPHGNYLDFIDKDVSREKAKNSFKIDPEKKVILFFGQIKKTKGLDILIAALGELVKIRTDFCLLIAGRPWKDDFSTYRSLIRLHRLEGFCKPFIEYIPQERVSLFFQVADLVVLPYREIYQSGVLLMALSFARAVVTSDLAVMQETITHGHTGFVFKTGDHKDLCKVLREIMDKKALLSQVALQGEKLVKDKYSWDKIAEKTRKVYESIAQ